MLINAILTGRVATALLMLLIFLAMSLLALGLPDKARLMPLMVGVPGSLLALLQLVLEIRGAIRSGPEHGIEAWKIRKAEWRMYAWVLLFFVGILGFGFVYGATALVFAFLFFGKREGLPTALISAAATWVTLYGVFEMGLELVLFKGLLLETLFG